MRSVYLEIKEGLILLFELIQSCQANEQKTFQVSERILDLMNRISSLSKRLPDSFTEQVDVLKETVDLFLQNPSNTKIFNDIRNLHTRILEEISRY